MNWQRYERLAFLFDPLERWVGNHSGFGDIRKKYIAPLEGKILEIGAGTGANFPYYSDKAEVIALEPSPKMLARAKQKLSLLNKKTISLELGRAEKIKYPDNYFDIVVSSLVFCSVDDPQKAINEIKRVLKFGGRAIFIEHVASNHKFLNLILKIINPFQKTIVGCNLQRHTGDIIRQSGLKLIKEENLKLRDVFRYFEARKE
jgi:ubiquinone/menaquinone biosynthesis C-methylase UbiE